ncbi:MAG: AAA family ATPase [Sphingobacteriales bacterium]|jgi:predicted ATPase|nr:AAA family ATPase [Sphingobacteriales bacterium]
MPISESALIFNQAFCEKLERVTTTINAQTFETREQEKEFVRDILETNFYANKPQSDFYRFLCNLYGIPLKDDERYILVQTTTFSSMVDEYAAKEHPNLLKKFTEIVIEYNNDKLRYRYGLSLLIAAETNTLINSVYQVNILCQISAKFNQWLLDYAAYIEQQEKQLTTFSKQSLPNCLTYFRINNFQCIKHIEAFEIPTDTQFIVFTGENGDGKTSILQAIGLGMHHSADLSNNNGTFDIELVYNSNHNLIHKQTSNDIAASLPFLDKNASFLNNFAAYGASRLKVCKTDPINPLFNLNAETAELQNITTYWLPRVADKQPKLYENIRQLLIKLLPNVSDIIYKDNNSVNASVVFVEKGHEVLLQNLSAGHKSIVLMIGDMILRLYNTQSWIDDPKDFTGIVLIDELEAHLHPKWQKLFPQILAETFPKVQFIVTTHSPITLLGMPNNTVIFNVQRNDDAGTSIERLNIDLTNLQPNLILTSPIFGMDNIFNTNNSSINLVHTGSDFAEIDARKNAKNRVKAIIQQLKEEGNYENGH